MSAAGSPPVLDSSSAADRPIHSGASARAKPGKSPRTKTARIRTALFSTRAKPVVQPESRRYRRPPRRKPQPPLAVETEARSDLASWLFGSSASALFVILVAF